MEQTSGSCAREGNFSKYYYLFNLKCELNFCQRFIFSLPYFFNLESQTQKKPNNLVNKNIIPRFSLRLLGIKKPRFNCYMKSNAVRSILYDRALLMYMYMSEFFLFNISYLLSFH